MTTRCSVLIVGAGLAGMSAAHHLRQLGVSSLLVIESENRPGGWAKTDWTGPWGADRAIHVLYFRDPQMRAWVDQLIGGAWREHRKNAVIDSRGIRTLFPFHAHLYGRPEEVVEECLRGIRDARIEAAKGVPPVTFADWIRGTLGAGVGKHFMDPYNTKQWTVPPSEMGWDWMGDFVPLPKLEDVLEGSRRPSDERVGLNATFRFASRGASQLSDALAATIDPIRFGTSLVGLRPDRHEAMLSDGSTVRYDVLVSTIPLQKLGQFLSPLPEPVHAAWMQLESVDLLLADVGFADPPPSDVHWAYLPDPDILAYRLHVVHALSPEMAPEGHGLYCLEISHSRHRPLPDADLRSRVVDDLVRLGWLESASQVRFFRERRFPCSYVIPRVGFKRDAAMVRDHARRFDIHSIGRYGEWKYCNQEDALLDGKRMAGSLVLAGTDRR